MNLLEKVQFLCNRKNLTISKLEKELGFSRGYIYKWEKSFPSSDKVKAISRFFSVDGNFLLGTDELDFSQINISDALNSEMKSQSLSVEELSSSTKIQKKVLTEILEGSENISEYILKILIFEGFGMEYLEFLEKYDLYTDYIPPIFGGSVANFEAFKKACENDSRENYINNFVENSRVDIVARGNMPSEEKITELAKELIQKLFEEI